MSLIAHIAAAPFIFIGMAADFLEFWLLGDACDWVCEQLIGKD